MRIKIIVAIITMISLVTTTIVLTVFSPRVITISLKLGLYGQAATAVNEIPPGAEKSISSLSYDLLLEHLNRIGIEYQIVSKNFERNGDMALTVIMVRARSQTDSLDKTVPAQLQRQIETAVKIHASKLLTTYLDDLKQELQLIERINSHLEKENISIQLNNYSAFNTYGRKIFELNSDVQKTLKELSSTQKISATNQTWLTKTLILGVTLLCLAASGLLISSFLLFSNFSLLYSMLVRQIRKESDKNNHV